MPDKQSPSRRPLLATLLLALAVPGQGAVVEDDVLVTATRVPEEALRLATRLSHAHVIRAVVGDAR